MVQYDIPTFKHILGMMLNLLVLFFPRKRYILFHFPPRVRTQRDQRSDVGQVLIQLLFLVQKRIFHFMCVECHPYSTWQLTHTNGTSRRLPREIRFERELIFIWAMADTGFKHMVEIRSMDKKHHLLKVGMSFWTVILL